LNHQSEKNTRRIQFIYKIKQTTEAKILKIPRLAQSKGCFPMLEGKYDKLDEISWST